MMTTFDLRPEWATPGHVDYRLAPCGCPIPPEVASGDVRSLGWHRIENHIAEEFDYVLGSLRDLDDRLRRLKDAVSANEGDIPF